LVSPFHTSKNLSAELKTDIKSGYFTAEITGCGKWECVNILSILKKGDKSG
jgi:hypothetical protein